MKCTQGSSFLERQSGSRRKENTAAVDSIMKEERNEHQAPKQTRRSQITGHPAPHLECCGHHLPLLSQTHPGAPDSAQAGPPPAHPPSATGKQKERGTHVTNSSKILPHSHAFFSPAWTKELIDHPCFTVCSPDPLHLWVLKWPQGKERADFVIPNLRWVNLSLRIQSKIQGCKVSEYQR